MENLEPLGMISLYMYLALGFCITLFAFSVFWQRRLVRVMGHGIPYQKHRCIFHLFFICCGLLSEFCGC